MSRFTQSIDRHGLWPTIVRSLFNGVRRFIDYEICSINCNSGDPYDWPYAADYETRIIEGEEFNQSLCAELDHTDYDYAFDRADLCVGSIRDAAVVGYTFYSQHPTRVRDGIDFVYPSSFIYSFASMTAPSHRGRKLERSRWKAAREERMQRTGEDTPIIWYNNVVNLEILAANAGSGDRTQLLGYTGYAKFFGRWFCFRSSGAVRLGAGFVRSGD